MPLLREACRVPWYCCPPGFDNRCYLMPIPGQKKDRVWNDPPEAGTGFTRGSPLPIESTIGALLFMGFGALQIIVKHGYLYLDTWNYFALFIAAPILGAIAGLCWKQLISEKKGVT